MGEVHNTPSLQSSSGAELEKLLNHREHLKSKKSANNSFGRDFKINVALAKNTILIANALRLASKKLDPEIRKEIKATLLSESPKLLADVARVVVQLLKEKELQKTEAKQPIAQAIIKGKFEDKKATKLKKLEANKTLVAMSSKDSIKYNESNPLLKILSPNEYMKSLFEDEKYKSGVGYRKQIDREFGDTRPLPYIDANGTSHNIKLDTVHQQKRTKEREAGYEIMYEGKNGEAVNVFPEGSKFTGDQQKRIVALSLGDESAPFFVLAGDYAEKLNENFKLGSMQQNDFNSVLSSISEDKNGGLKLHKQERYPVLHLEKGDKVGYVVVSRSYDVKNPDKMPEVSMKFYEGSEPPTLSPPGLSPSNTPSSPPKNSIKV